MLLRVWVLDAPRTGAALPSAGTARARGNAMDVPPWFAMGPPQRSAYLDADAAEEFSSYVSNMIAQGPDALVLELAVFWFCISGLVHWDA